MVDGWRCSGGSEYDRLHDDRPPVLEIAWLVVAGYKDFSNTSCCGALPWHLLERRSAGYFTSCGVHSRDEPEKPDEKSGFHSSGLSLELEYELLGGGLS